MSEHNYALLCPKILKIKDSQNSAVYSGDIARTRVFRELIILKDYNPHYKLFSITIFKDEKFTTLYNIDLNNEFEVVGNIFEPEDLLNIHNRIV